jgi:hypothetical protein
VPTDGEALWALQVSQRIDWGVQDVKAEEGALRAMLASGHHLVAVAGTAAKFNSNVHVFVRTGINWAEQFVHRSPRYEPRAPRAHRAQCTLRTEDHAAHAHAARPPLTGGRSSG